MKYLEKPEKELRQRKRHNALCEWKELRFVLSRYYSEGSLPAG